jgi:hypothetical protein
VKAPRVLPASLIPKTLVLRDVAVYLGLGSPQAAERWLSAHGVMTVIDRLGYRRAFVKDIDAAQVRLLAEVYDGRKVSGL